MPAPTPPLTIDAVITGPLSLMSENTITAGSMAFAEARRAISSLKRKDHSSGRFRESHQCERFRPDCVQLAQELAALPRSAEARSRYSLTEETQLPEPFEERNTKTLRCL